MSSTSIKSSVITLIIVTSCISSLNAFSIEKKPLNKYKLKLLKDDLFKASTESILDGESSEYEETTDLRFLYQCIDQHNQYRKSLENEEGEVSEEKIILFSSEVEKIARKRALKLASTGKMALESTSTKSLSGEGIGENVAFTSVPNNNATSAKFVDCRPIVDLWYSDAYGIEKESVPVDSESAEEIKKVTIGRKLANSQIRNYIWHEANEIGCAQVSTFHTANPGVYTVCNYRFTENSF